jgi:hypothetical protein
MKPNSWYWIAIGGNREFLKPPATANNFENRFLLNRRLPLRFAVEFDGIASYKQFCV